MYISEYGEREHQVIFHVNVIGQRGETFGISDHYSGVFLKNSSGNTKSQFYNNIYVCVQ